jgi:hypothetical protein
MTASNFARVELADRVLGDRIAMRSSLLPHLVGAAAATIKAERSVIFQARKGLYSLNADEIESLIATQLNELDEDKSNLIM